MKNKKQFCCDYMAQMGYCGDICQCKKCLTALYPIQKKPGHTPGRWKVGNGYMVYTSDLRFCIAKTEAEPEYQTGEQEANARLIAAAPELLAALQAMVESVTDEEAEDHDLGQGHDAESCALCMAREAIAKAEGGK